MTTLTIRKVPERCLWAGLLFCTVYQSYRYPLQMNYSGTSPTYTDTPAVFQAGKFCITLLICLIALCYIPKRLIPYKKWILAVLTLFMSAFPVLKMAGAEFTAVAVYLGVAFWPFAALLLAISTRSITAASLNRYLKFVFFYALVSNFIEVLLFVTIGRLPALAYANSFSVRFGGFLDDPNGFAALVYMLMGWAYYYFSGAKRILAEIALILCILLTQSFTALGFFVLLAIIFSGGFLIRRAPPLVTLIFGVAVTTILVFIWPAILSLVSIIAESRSGSVDAHLSQVSASKVRAGVDYLLGGAFIPYESWWVGSLINFGIPWYLLSLSVIAVLVASTFIAFRRVSSLEQKAVIAGTLMLSIYFIFGNGNLPFFTVFPINFLFFLFSFLIFFDRIIVSGRATADAQ